MSGKRSAEGTRRLALDQPFVLESGRALPGVEIAYRTWGRLAPAGDNAVVVCHALTGSADADIWWSDFFGPGRTLDPTRDFIVCSNALGSCYGTTGPNSLAPDGQRWAGRFPRISVRDQVRLQIALADHLGIRRIRFVLGGSMGGLQSLEWALLDPARVGAVISIAAAGRHSAWCAAWSEAQRLAIAADPKFRQGHYPEHDPPADGLAAARAIAMVSYRSAQSLAQRFGRASGSEIHASRSTAPDEPAVRGWLRHHGRSLVERFDANSYLTLIDAMDSHDLARGRGVYENVLQQVRQPALIGSVISDALYVPAEQRELSSLLLRGELFAIESEQGHDGFLIDAGIYEPRVRRFVDRLPGGTADQPEEPQSARVGTLRFAW